MMSLTQRMRRPARRGFTLVEMLVVLTIILILISLSVAAVFKVLNAQQRSNTEQLVTKAERGFVQQTKPVLAQAKTDQINPIAQALAGNDALAPNRARVIHTLMCMRREFPVSFNEILNPPAGFPANPAYVRALSNASAASLSRSPEDQSSACLYMALKQRRAGADFDPDTALSSQELSDPFNDGVKELYDAWNRPIIFNRWPSAGYGVGVGNPPTPAIGSLLPFNPSAPPDPQDPEGLLTNAGWLNWLQANNFVGTFGTSVGYPIAGGTPPPNMQANVQFKLTPVIMSVGSNGKYDAGNPGSDDIINFQLR